MPHAMQDDFHVQLLSLYNLPIRYDSGYLTCSKKLTGSQLSLPHGKSPSLPSQPLVMHTLLSCLWCRSETIFQANRCDDSRRGGFAPIVRM